MSEFSLHPALNVNNNISVLRGEALTGGVLDGQDLSGLAGVSGARLVLRADLELDLSSLDDVRDPVLTVRTRRLPALHPASAQLLLLLQRVSAGRGHSHYCRIGLSRFQMWKFKHVKGLVLEDGSSSVVLGRLPLQVHVSLGDAEDAERVGWAGSSCRKMIK